MKKEEEEGSGLPVAEDVRLGEGVALGLDKSTDRDGGGDLLLDAVITSLQER